MVFSFVNYSARSLGHPDDESVSSHLSTLALNTWDGQFKPHYLDLLSQTHLPHVMSRLVHHCWPLHLHDHDTAREDRLCRFCGEDVESEWHVLLHCPALDLVRSNFPDLDFTGSFQHLLAHSGQTSDLVDYLLKIFSLLHPD